MAKEFSADHLPDETEPIEVTAAFAEQLAQMRTIMLEKGLRIDLATDGELLQIAYEIVQTMSVVKMQWSILVGSLLMKREEAEKNGTL